MPGIAGKFSIAAEGYADASAFDPKNHHDDPDSKKDAPSWYAVDVKFARKFKRVVTLEPSCERMPPREADICCCAVESSVGDAGDEIGLHFTPDL